MFPFRMSSSPQPAKWRMRVLQLKKFLCSFWISSFKGSRPSLLSASTTRSSNNALRSKLDRLPKRAVSTVKWHHRCQGTSILAQRAFPSVRPKLPRLLWSKARLLGAWPGPTSTNRNLATRAPGSAPGRGW